MNLTLLEKAVLEMMIEDSGEHFETIKQQLAAASIGRREFSGVGFFSHFIVQSSATINRDLPDMELKNVGAEFPDLKHGAGFVLFIRDGVINMLEGFTYDENWPEKIDVFKLFKN